jgi:class 3 adenylate cyclase
LLKSTFYGGEGRSEFIAIGGAIRLVKKIKEKLSPGDIVLSNDVMNFMNDEMWKATEAINLQGFEDGESFYKLIA